jgi:hypothetical protein
MIFTHKSKALSRPLLNPNPNPNPMPRSNPNPIRREQPKPATPQEVKDTAKPMRWGGPTWLFFHTLAEKVREDQFPLIRGPLLNMISNVCTNLPCPDCAKHAREYMSKINFNAIRTKDDLKELFFGFHNTVNARKGFPIVDKTELDKYAQYSLANVIANFMHYFENRHMSPRLMADDFSRRQTAANIKQWIMANMASFM